VAIVVPNHLHSRAAAAFLASGIHVICDKPLATTLADARELQQLQKASRRLFMLTYNYTGYPMIREARARIAAGQLGRLRLVQVEYAQDWLSPDVERRGSKQAKWRTDPGLAGAGGALGDIGTHAWNLAAYVCGETPTSVLCESTAFGSGRILDDNAFVLMRYQSGARGALWVSQVAVGNDNRLRLRIYGERGGLEWCHEAPDVLVASEIGVPSKLLTRNGNGVGPEATRVARVPAGHPEGFLEGFATLYSEFALAIRAADNRLPPDPNVQYPTVEDGVSGLEFIGACVLSSTKGGLWVNLADLPS
jgi:predicted dehydrogenase